MKLSRIPISVWILLGSSLLFMPFLGAVHLFDWDEINFAESAREMIASGEYTYVQINYEPFWEKPPLFIWMQVLSMKMWGVNEFAARFPNALAGLATLLVLFTIGKRERDAQFGLLWVMAYAGSFLPYIYFKSGIIDPWFNLFIFLGIYFGFRYLTDSEAKWRHALLLGLFTGASMLTKGPVGPLIVGLVGGLFLLFYPPARKGIRGWDVLMMGGSFLAIGGLWFFMQMAAGRWDVVVDFVVYQIRLFQTQDAGHGGFFGYHVVVLLVGVFPASIWAIPALLRAERGESASFSAMKLLMQLTFWVVLILFSIVKTKIIHYSSMCYFPLTYLATVQLEKMWQNRAQAKSWQWGMLLCLGTLLGIAVMSLAFAEDIQAWLGGAEWLKDPFAKGNLQAEVGWRGYEWIPGLMLLGGIWVAWFMRNKLRRALVLTFVASGLFMALASWWVVPRIERISQHAAVAFFESHASEDAYMTTVYYKSYTPYFYGKVKPTQPQEAADREWLLAGPIDKPVYISTKINRREQIETTYPDLTFLYEQNGFLFYRRDPFQEVGNEIQ